MSEVISQLPEHGAVETIREAERATAELKSAKRMSGLSGQLSYLIQTAAVWDKTEAISAPSGSTDSSTPLEFDIVATGDGSQDYPEIQLYLDIRINGTATANKLVVLNGTYSSNVRVAGELGFSSGATLYYANSYDGSHTMTGKVHSWHVKFQFKGSMTYYLKAVCRASCPGTVVVTRTV